MIFFSTDLDPEMTAPIPEITAPISMNAKQASRSGLAGTTLGNYALNAFIADDTLLLHRVSQVNFVRVW